MNYKYKLTLSSHGRRGFLTSPMQSVQVISKSTINHRTQTMIEFKHIAHNTKKGRNIRMTQGQIKEHISKVHARHNNWETKGTHLTMPRTFGIPHSNVLNTKTLSTKQNSQNKPMTYSTVLEVLQNASQTTSENSSSSITYEDSQHHEPLTSSYLMKHLRHTSEQPSKARK